MCYSNIITRTEDEIVTIHLKKMFSFSLHHIYIISYDSTDLHVCLEKNMSF